MVRTKADAGGSSGSRKAIGGNAPRKALGGAGPSSDAGSPAGKGAGKYAGGNPVCQRPTPEWQKGIGGFLCKNVSSTNKENTIPNDEIEVLESNCSKPGSSKNSEPGNSKSDS